MTSRLFGVGIEGPRIDPEEREILAADPPFGLILFRRNIETSNQVRQVIAEAKGLGVRLVFVDEEGGPVDRLKDLLAPFPSFRAVARSGLARRAGELIGEVLVRLAFDVDLAPVVDRGLEGAGALVLGERCADDDPDAIVLAAGGFLDGLHSRGIAGCLKHFPGLGRARADTHRELPVLSADLREEERDLLPFRALGEKAGAILISHAAGADGAPATLSRSVATALLRGEVGFSGAAFSDDLEMGALDRFGDLPRRCVAACLAGCDLLFVCRRICDYRDCVRAVEREIPTERVAESVRRLEAYAERREELARRATVPERPLAAIVEDIRRLQEDVGGRT